MKLLSSGKTANLGSRPISRKLHLRLILNTVNILLLRVATERYRL